MKKPTTYCLQLFILTNSICDKALGEEYLFQKTEALYFVVGTNEYTSIRGREMFIKNLLKAQCQSVLVELIIDNIFARIYHQFV